jgi:hypothetical protein
MKKVLFTLALIAGAPIIQVQAAGIDPALGILLWVSVALAIRCSEIAIKLDPAGISTDGMLSGSAGTRHISKGSTMPSASGIVNLRQ